MEMNFKTEITAKICPKCDGEMTEMFDSYTEKCPECHSEHSKVLVNSNGVWVWQ
jgi:Zn finger protein HypA/HybF involved in hydrogenase expression